MIPVQAGAAALGDGRPHLRTQPPVCPYRKWDKALDNGQRSPRKLLAGVVGVELVVLATRRRFDDVPLSE